MAAENDRSRSAPPFELSVDGLPEGALHVHSFSGEERLSEAYSLEIVVTADAAGERFEEAALGRPAVFVVNVGAEPRAFHGVVAAVRLAEVHSAADAVQYRVRVAPRLWLLKRKQRTRIFQKMRVPDVVTAVLQEAGIQVRWQLVRAYPVREHCTQYEETDYAFVRRLLAEAGVYFYFATGPRADAAALAASRAIGAATAAGEGLLGAVGGPLGEAVGSAVGAAASLAGPLVPGDTVICADDALSYPPVAGDDPAALAASTAAALAPAAADALGADSGVAGAVIGGASAAIGAAIAGASTGQREAPVLRLRATAGTGVASLDGVARFTLRNSVRSSGAVFRDYDPARPAVRLQSTAVSTAPFPPSALEVAGEIAGAAAGVASGLVPAAADVLGAAEAAVNDVAGALGQRVPFEVYEHHSPYLFPKWAFAAEEAPLILRQKRRRASVAEGESDCPDLSPGHRFALRGHPASQLDRAYVLTRVRHRGRTRAAAGAEWKVYTNEIECAPAEVTFVPPRPRRRSVQVMLTATVTGPGGQEIHVDPMGQIKVQFHWDREGRLDERSSCWIRTMHPWAGAAWGHQFIPRVGMEVVVVFEGGDPDKPLVIGSLYNGTHPPPFSLPQHGTRSGIRTRSSPGGHGYNELSFEDHAGEERIHLHAQRDYEEIIRHDRTSHVHRNRSVEIGGSSGERVAGHAALHVHGHRTAAVGGDDRLTVDGRSHAEVKGDRSAEIHGACTTTVHRAHSVEVRGARTLVVGSPDDPSPSDHYVHGSASLGASERIVIDAEKGVVLRCGDASIELGPDRIVLRAPTVELSPGQALECGKKDGPSLTLGDGVEILTKKFQVFTEGGALEVDREVKAKGGAIKLGYDPSKPSKGGEEKDPETRPFSCKLTDYNLVPHARKKYHLTAEGLRFEGETDGDGVVKQDIPKSARQVVVRLWIDEYPEGRQRVYTLRLAALPAATDVLGAKQRLRNLGYFDGLLDMEKGPDLSAAVAEFQQDHRDSHGLDPTGELDEGTAGAIEEVHGS